MYRPAPVKAMVLKSLLPMVQVELQEGLEQIDYYAYEYCSSLEHHIRIPSTITEIEPWTFRTDENDRNPYPGFGPCNTY